MNQGILHNINIHLSIVCPMAAIFFLLLLGCPGCTSTPDLSKIQNLNQNTIGVLGHGGLGPNSRNPMNSLPAIKGCIKLGAIGTEIDIQLTKDQVFVLYHDEFLESKTSGTGKISELTWPEIEGVYYQQFFKKKTPVMRLDSMLANINNPQNFLLTFDCKLYTPLTPAYTAAFVEALIKVVEQYQRAKTVFIELRQEALIRTLLQQKPHYKVFALGSFEWAFRIAKQHNAYGISVTDKDISLDQVSLAHQDSLFVTFYTSGRTSDVIEKNPDFIQTNKLDYFLQLIPPQYPD